MRKFKFSACAALLIVATVTLLAHEEPAKTLREKEETAAYRQVIAKAGIRRIVTFKQEIVEGKETGERIKVMTQEFDRTGSLVSLETYKENEADTRVEYIYDRDLNISEQKTFKPAGKLLDRDVFEFDKEGRVLSGKTYNDKGEVFETFQYVHSPDKKKITFVKYRGKPEPDYAVAYLFAEDYDRSGPVEAIKRDEVGHVVMKVREERDAKGVRTDKVLFDKDLKETKRFHYDYDESGDLVKVTTLAPGETSSPSETYSYVGGIRTEERGVSADGKVTSIIRHDFEHFAREPDAKSPGGPQRMAHLGGEMRGGEVTSIAELSAHPERWFNKDVRIAGIIASACTQEGCFIEVVPVTGPGEGILVNFADSGLKFPADCAGRSVVVEGMFYQKVYPASRVAHWQGHSFRKGKAIPSFSLIKRLTAKAADIGEKLSGIPVPGDIVEADTGRIDLTLMEFETTGFGTGRKVLAPGEATEKHSTGRVREMIFCLEGDVRVHMEGSKAVTLKAGEMSFIPPATNHELKNDGANRCVYLFVYSKAEEEPAGPKHTH